MSRRAHPIRMCVGCGARAPQGTLVRVTSGPDGVLQLARQRTHAGRSAYLHTEPSCWERFAARKGPVRSLGRTVDKPKRLAFVEELKRVELSAMVR